jgi:carboxylesterase
MGERLSENGFTTLGPRLYAHGTDIRDMRRSRYWDWINSVLDGYYMLNYLCDEVFVMGLSMGGALSLLISTLVPVRGLVVMATPTHIPIWYVEALRPVIPLLSNFWQYRSKGTPDWQDPQAYAEHSAYEKQPVRAGAELQDLLAEMRRRLPEVTQPLLLVYSKDDGTVPESDAEEIRQSVRSKDVRLEWIQGSGHNITRDAKREEVFRLAIEFVKFKQTR